MDSKSIHDIMHVHVTVFLISLRYVYHKQHYVVTWSHFRSLSTILTAILSYQVPSPMIFSLMDEDFLLKIQLQYLWCLIKRMSSKRDISESHVCKKL